MALNPMNANLHAAAMEGLQSFVPENQLLKLRNELQSTRIDRFFCDQTDLNSFLNELDRIVNPSMPERK